MTPVVIPGSGTVGHGLEGHLHLARLGARQPAQHCAPTLNVRAA